MPKKRPLFTFRVDPKVLAETLLAVADLLPDTSRAVQFFYYGDGLPLGFCARNSETGMMIDALVVPLVIPKQDPKTDKNGQPDAKADKSTESEAKSPTEPTPDPKDLKAQDAKHDNSPANGRDAKKSKAKP